MSATVGPLELLVGGLAVVVGAATLLQRSRLAAAVSYLLLGLCLALVHAMLGAPDVALAEAAIGSGVTGALFVYAVTRAQSDSVRATNGGARGRHGPAGTGGVRHRVNVPLVLFAAGATALITFGMGTALQSVAGAPAGPVEGVRPLVEQAMPQSGVDHRVTAVLLNFRGYDTFLEIVVLLVSVVVVLNLADRDRPPASTDPRPSILDRYVRLVSPMLVLIAAWMLFAGSSSPGGAFQAGAVVAAVLVLLALAGYRVADLGGRAVRWTAVAGVAAFLAVAAIGALSGGAWFELPREGAGPVIIVLESVLAAVIGASLAVSFLALRAEERGDG